MSNSIVLTTFESLALALGDGFSKRARRYVLPIMLAWILVPTRKTLKRIFDQTLIRRARSGCYRFFSAFKWGYARIARDLLRTALELLGSDRVLLAVDDTLSPKSGPTVFGCSRHCDHHAGPRSMIWGHNWVIVALVIQVPIWKRWISLPLLAWLYMRRETAKKADEPFRTKLVLAVQMIQMLTEGLEIPIAVVADGAYTNEAVLTPLRKRNILFVGRLRHDVVLHALKPRSRKGTRGRRPIYGSRLPKLSRMGKRLKFRKIRLQIYSGVQTLWVAELTAVWKSARGPIKIVIARKRRADPRPIYLMSSDLSLSAEQVVQVFSARWSIEIAIRNAKMHLGLGQARVRTKASVLRVTHFCLWIQTLIVLAWFQQHAWVLGRSLSAGFATGTQHPISFAAMLSELRTALVTRRISYAFDPGPGVVQKLHRFMCSLLAAA